MVSLLGTVTTALQRESEPKSRKEYSIQEVRDQVSQIVDAKQEHPGLRPNSVTLVSLWDSLV